MQKFDKIDDIDELFSIISCRIHEFLKRNEQRMKLRQLILEREMKKKEILSFQVFKKIVLKRREMIQ